MFIPKRVQFRHLPIRTKLHLGFSFLFTIMAVLSIITYYYYKADKQNNTLDAVKQLNLQTLDKLDEAVTGLTNITKLPLLRENGTYNTLFQEIDTSNTTGTFSVGFPFVISTEGYKYMMFNPMVDSIFLYNRMGRGDFYIPGRSLHPSDFPAYQQPWFQQALEDYKRPILIGTYKIPNANHPDRPYYVFGVARGIYKLETGETIGVILINGSFDRLLKMLDNMKIVENEQVLLLDHDNRILADHDLGRIGERLDLQLGNELVAGNKELSKKIEINGVRYLLRMDTSAQTGWKIVSMLPLEELYKNITRLTMTTTVITLSLVGVSFIFAFVFSRSIVRPVQNLVKLMRIGETGVFEKQFVIEREDEIGQLARSFNKMSARIRTLINDIYVEKVVQKELELQMLKNQINPHFLYNTLESIRMVAEARKAEDIAEMAYSLGKILRYGISLNRDVVKVREEVEHLEQYVMLQKVRFDELFEIQLEIDEAILDHYMLKLILQPIVENAIYHGLSMRRSEGLIQVRGYSDDNRSLLFEVSDNGCGMDPEKVDGMNAAFRDVNSKMAGIGLYNVNKRIQLYYGSPYGLTIVSTPGAGTTVLVRMPIQRLRLEEVG
ncbi:sensor histidine kinase [Gorillibacterium sp. sgz5001074]|uniref:sensor histidine kinase n=1 Tax=Gorillibacterium sp. sgz5001074 TaxID=3446695 RepID=UPI003F66E1DE